jgi:hypothetical protein
VTDSLSGPPTKIRRLDADGAGRLDQSILWGLTTRTVALTSRRKKEHVILWGNRFCLWIGILGELGLLPAATILSSLNTIHLAQGAAGIECFVGTPSNFQKVLLPSLRGKVWLGLVDGRVLANFANWRSIWIFLILFALLVSSGKSLVGKMT